MSQLNSKKRYLETHGDSLDIIKDWRIPVAGETSLCEQKKRKNGENCVNIDEAYYSATSIEDLNDDCLEHIFMYIPIIDRFALKIVSKRWRKVSKLVWSRIKSLDLLESSSLNDLDLLPDVCKNNFYIGLILKNCGESLKVLKLGDLCTYRILKLVGEYCVNLTRLELEFKKYGKRFTTLFSGMGELEYFGMKNIARDVHDDFWGENPPERLKEIDLQGVDWDILKIYPSALETFTNLSSITLEQFTLPQEMMTLLGSRVELTFLSLANCRIEGEIHRLTQLTNLEHLNLSKVSELNDKLLTQLTKNCRNLRQLNLNNCSTLSPTGFMSLDNLQNLEELFVNSCDITDSIFIKLFSLKRLECKNCRNVQNNGIIQLLEHAVNLRHLNLVNTRVNEQVINKAAKVSKRITNDLKLWIIVNKSLKLKWEMCEERVDSDLLVVFVEEEASVDVDSLIEKYGARHFVSDDEHDDDDVVERHCDCDDDDCDDHNNGDYDYEDDDFDDEDHEVFFI